MIVNANAKINLSLDIVGVREDGYHELKTVMQSLDLCDEIHLSKNKTGEITLTCNRRDIPTDRKNTAYKAAELMLEYAGIKDMGVNIFIKKEIPSQAGMGGGSADAAAVLSAMKELFAIDITDEELYDMAVHIGADVPFCLHGGTCLCEGIGEEMTVLSDLPDCEILVCKPPVNVSTGRAYEEADKYPQDDGFMTPAMVEAVNSGDMDAVCDNVSNRFDEILHIPEVQIIKSIMSGNGALAVSMTGSGSAVFGIFEKDYDMAEVVSMLKGCGDIFKTRPARIVNK